jgi:cyanophycinase
MHGYLLLAGGAEFGGGMATVDRRALELAGGLAAPVRIIPTAAAPDGNHARAGANGVRWFRSLGAADVESVALLDRASASYPDICAALKTARLVYLLGGFPGYLAQTLRETPAWQAVLEALQNGAVLGGSSAGAMVLCEHVFDPYNDAIVPGLGLLGGVCVLPHHNTFGKSWAPRLKQSLPGATLVGIDEQTGMLANAPGETWQVYGSGCITVYAPSGVHSYCSGDQVMLNPRPAESS